MRIFKPRMGFLLLPALPLLVWTPASLAQDEKWEIDGNANLGANSFLGSVLGENDFVLFKTDGMDRMKIFERDTTGLYSDIDGVFQIYTNLHLNPSLLYNGDLIMPWGRWKGRDFAPGGNAGLDAGDLMMTKGDLAVMLGEFSVTNEDGLELFTVSDGPDSRLILDFADLWVKDGNAFLGPKPGNPPGSTNKNNLFVSSGQVFIGDKQLPTSAPPGLGPVIPPTGQPVLRIDGVGDFGFAGEVNHVVFIKSYDLDPTNPSTTADGIAIQLDGLTTAPYLGVTHEKNNFITFYDGNGLARGAIEGTLTATNPPFGGPGITIKSGSADFAEYLEKMDPLEDFQVGEIVGVFAGRVSKQIDGADHILVITAAPFVLGNAPQVNDEHLFAKVAFLGQVPVLVIGEVNPGDYILPSGLNDGFGIAVSPDDLQLEDLPAIVGTAWSGSNGGYVNLALGFKAINWGQVIETNVPNKPEMIALTERVRQLELIIQGLTGRRSRNGPTNN